MMTDLIGSSAKKISVKVCIKEGTFRNIIYDFNHGKIIFNYNHKRR